MSGRERDRRRRRRRDDRHAVELATGSSPGTPRRCSCAASSRARSSASAAPCATRSTARRAARARSDGVPTGEEPVEVSDKGTVTTFCVVNVPFDDQQMEIPYVSATSCSTAPTSPLHLIQEAKAEDVRMGMRVEAVWAPRRGARAHPREHQVLPADRRARRRLRRLQGARLMRTAADEGRRDRRLRAVERPRASPPQRGRDAHAGRRRGARRLGLDRKEIGFTCSGSCDYLAGARVRVRLGARRGRGRGRRSARATSRWTAPGRCTRRGSGSSTARSTPRSSTASASRRRGDLPIVLSRSSTRTTWRRSGPTRRSPRSRRAPGSTPATTEGEMAAVAARSRRCAEDNPSAQLDGDESVDALLDRAVRRLAAAQARHARRSPTAPRRSCSPPATWRATLCEQPGVDPRHRPPHRAARPRRARPRRTSPSTRPAGEKAGVDGGRRRRAARAVQPPGADPARGARPRATA